MDKCKSCSQEIVQPQEAYIINKQNEKLCKTCAERLIANSNLKEPGRLKVTTAENGQKKIVRKF